MCDGFGGEREWRVCEAKFMCIRFARARGRVGYVA